MYGVEPMFWRKLFFVIGILSLLLFSFDFLMRKHLNLEKGKIFSYNHVNDKHKKIDWTIRISYLIIILITLLFTIKSNGETIWYLQIWFIMFVYLTTAEMVKAFMEWKYAENRKKYIFTISKLIFTLILLWILFYTNFFNLFNF